MCILVIAACALLHGELNAFSDLIVSPADVAQIAVDDFLCHLTPHTQWCLLLRTRRLRTALLTSCYITCFHSYLLIRLVDLWLSIISIIIVPPRRWFFAAHILLKDSLTLIDSD
jgi:hypothetical protein